MTIKEELREYWARQKIFICIYLGVMFVAGPLLFALWDDYWPSFWHIYFVSSYMTLGIIAWGLFLLLVTLLAGRLFRWNEDRQGLVVNIIVWPVLLTLCYWLRRLDW